MSSRAISSGLILFTWSGLASTIPTSDVPFVELAVLVLTVALLAILTRYSVMTFTTDVDASISAQRDEMEGIRTSFSQDTTRLLDRNAEHWRDQSASLERAVRSMEEVAVLQRQSLQTTQQTLTATIALLDLERQRETLRAEETRLRIQRIRPAMAFCGFISHPGVVAKRVGIRLFNQGEDGRRVTVVLRHGPGSADVTNRAIPSVAAFSNAEADFGDIDEWPDDLGLAVEVSAYDADGNRYRCTGSLRYSRNRGILGSSAEPTNAV